tara:strand:+ start:862 stop:2361 length:1500 start_codon:yes stop_codon:yes gene_type:complete
MTFDDVMNLKCSLSNPQNPNYVGPWDGDTRYGKCEKYECPSEMCYYLSPDPSFPIVNGKTWVSKSIPQQFNIDSKECITNHGSMSADNSIKYFCDTPNPKKYKNNENHLEKKTCYEYDEDYQRFVGSTYYNVLDSTDDDGSNIYIWKGGDSVQYTANQSDISTCMETKLDCSACNYYCCEYDPIRRCDGTPRTLTSDDINRIVTYKYEPNEKKCIKDDENSANCFGDSSCDNLTFSKDCWHYDTYNLVWKNEKFIKQKRPDGTCLYVNARGDIWNESLYRHDTPETSGDPFCLSNLEGKKTNEECNKLNNVNCDYIDINEQHQSITYKPTLNYAGTECVWKTLDKRHFIQTYSLEQTTTVSPTPNQTPEMLNEPRCPLLSPKSCKNSNNEYLRQYDDQTAPECVPCPIDMFRNSNMQNEEVPFSNEDLYCTPKVSCNTTSATQCMVKISPNTNIFRNLNIPTKRNDLFLPTHRSYGKGDQCVPDAEWAESNCERIALSI